MIIYVSNLSPGVTEEELQKEFMAFGEVTSVRIVRDRYSGQSRGFGFVVMPSKSRGKEAIIGLKGKRLHDRALDISEASPDFGSRGTGFFGGRRGGWFGGPRYSIGVLRSASDIEDFIKGLTDADSADIEKFTAEIMSNREFHEHLGANRRSFGGGFYGIGAMLGVTVYVLCRKIKPDAVVETGVSSGVSSAYILCALDENKHGELYSIDLPWGEQSGWIIPDYLRHRWHLELGRSSEKLPPLLKKLGTIDIFLHDSEHSYQNMLFEYQTAWAYLKAGGILLSHNVGHNYAFPDFCQSVGLKGFLLTDMGGIAKV